jgi:trehalose-phosphatase
VSTDSQAIADIVGIIEKHADELLVLTGFDGVLVDYTSDPDSVRLSPTLRQQLLSIDDRPNVVLGIVSGRPASDVKERAGLGNNVFYLGLHGLQVEGPDFSRVEDVALDAQWTAELAAALQESLASVAGIRIENKGAALAVHTRDTGPVDAVWARLRVLNAAAELVSAQELRVIRGNHVFELIPNVPQPKGAAIEATCEYLKVRDGKDYFVLYVGEDVVDDDAIDAVGCRGVAVAVGRRAQRAHFHLASPAMVRRLIARLIAMIGARPTALLATIALVLVAACGNATEPERGGDSGSAERAASGTGGESRSPVDDYLRFAAEGTKADVDQHAMAEGLRKLAGALGTLSLGDATLQVDLRVAAEHILLNPSSPATAATVRDGLVAAAEAVQSAGDSGDSLTRLAESIRPEVPLVDQRAAVNEFFVAAAKALEPIARRS